MIWLPRRPRMPLGFWGVASASVAEAVINITDESILGFRSFGETGSPSRAGIQFLNTGILRERENASLFSVSNEWQHPWGGLTASDFTVSWTRISGISATAIHGGLAQSTQYNLGSTRDIYLDNPNADTIEEIVIEVSIWPAAGGARVDFAQYTLSAVNAWI